MQSLKRQIYFVATISMMLYGLANTDYIKGLDILSDKGDFIEPDDQNRQAASALAQSAFAQHTSASESRDQESSSDTVSETAPPADSIDPTPAASEQERADSAPTTTEETRVDSTIRTIERDRTDTTPRMNERPHVAPTPRIKAQKVVYSPSVTKGQNRIDRKLQTAITSRIGLPYLSGGIDDRGFDCSGFVWRVFQEAGIDFQRGSARTYWETMPEATAKERTQFGTLVFFDNSRHVGVVCDANSFYHSSTSQGVTRSSFSGYWGGHVIGYRRVRLPQDISMVR